MDTEKLQFLNGEFGRALTEYARSDAQTHAAHVDAALDSGDIDRANRAIATFMDSTAESASYDHELAYTIALDGRGDPTFSARHVPESVLRRERRPDFERAVREGQMDRAASIIGMDQFGKLRAILQKISSTINA